LENLKFSGNYTFTEAAERFALRIPKHKVNGNLNFTISENTFTSLSYQFNDDRTDNFFNNETFVNEIVELDSYGILDYYISHQINTNIKVFGGVTNITNEEYQEIFRFNTRGRNARFGVSLNF
jgi:vitamin B12 transporter